MRHYIKVLYFLVTICVVLNLIESKTLLRESLAENEKPFNTAKITYNYIWKYAYTENKKVHDEGKIITYLDCIKNRRRDEITLFDKLGNSQKKETLLIVNDNQGYLIDPATKTGYKSEEPEPAILAIKPSRLDKMDYIGEEQILGKTCAVYSIGFSKFWIWDGFLLKEETKKENAYVLKEVEKIEENIKIDDSLFNVPADIKLTP